MDKLGIVSVYKKVNYGTVLQAYALQVILVKLIFLKDDYNPYDLELIRHNIKRRSV